MKNKFILMLFFSIFSTTTYFYFFSNNTPLDNNRIPSSTYDHRPVKDFYSQNVRPLLDKRCVVCHGCYSSPCNLKLDSYEGIERGASKDDIYGNRPLEEMKPIRLFEDAKTAEEWHTKYNFTPVISNSDSPTVNLENSLLYQMISLRKNKTEGNKEFKFAATTSRTCVRNLEEYTKYADENGHLAGMPYGVQELTESDFQVLERWIEDGALGPSKETLASRDQTFDQFSSMVHLWEQMLNDKSSKNILTARYLYEHLFLAHLYLDSGESRQFFRLVRSKTASPFMIDEIATTRPYDFPGEQFYYRLRPVTYTLVYKNHTPFKFNQETFKRVNELFIDAAWPVESFAVPGYEASEMNPFYAFRFIPAKNRYQFLLENAEYVVRTFIRGPVCNGQIATNVVRDHFYVLFLDPDSDKAVTDNNFLIDNAKNLEIPAFDKELVTHSKYAAKFRRYTRRLNKLYRDKQFNASDIWDGDQTNANATLTVFRYFDSASVNQGLIGTLPKTAWVIDYPLMELIYYDLVAGFNVYSNLLHKMATRQYMNLLRQYGENNFIAFVDRKDAKFVKKYWNRDIIHLSSRERSSSYLKSINIVNRFFSKVQSERIAAPIIPKVEVKDQSIDNKLQSVRKSSQPFAKYFPEIVLLKVEKNDGTSFAYSIIANKDFQNMNQMLIDLREPENDSLDIVPGFFGDYPNFFMKVSENDLEQFVSRLNAMSSEEDWNSFRASFGIERLSNQFWAVSDWFQEEIIKYNPIDGALLDLSRYL